MDDASTIAALERRVAELETLVASLVGEHASAATPAAITAEPVDEPVAPAPATDEVVRFDRRRLLARGGTAAVGAVLGGAAATIATAGPAAAATGSFDTSTGTPALTVTSTGSGAALQVTGRSTMDGPVVVTSEVPTGANALEVRAKGPNNSGIVMKSEANGALFIAQQTGLWAIGDLAIEATGGRHGVLAWGSQAQILLAGRVQDSPLDPPRERTDQHERGELYFDDDGGLWLCTAEGTPGTWSLVGGAGTAGAFTVLATPTRVYDTRTGSGLPGAGTGPVTGVRKDIDLTAAIPADATAALVTLTVTDTQANPSAYGQIYANALPTPPGTSSINWTAANSLVATTTTTAVSNGKVAISMNPGANVLIDVLGYHR